MQCNALPTMSVASSLIPILIQVSTLLFSWVTSLSFLLVLLILLLSLALSAVCRHSLGLGLARSVNVLLLFCPSSQRSGVVHALLSFEKRGKEEGRRGAFSQWERKRKEEEERGPAFVERKQRKSNTFKRVSGKGTGTGSGTGTTSTVCSVKSLLLALHLPFAAVSCCSPKEEGEEEARCL